MSSNTQFVFIAFGFINLLFVASFGRNIERWKRDAEDESNDDLNATSYIIGGATASPGQFPWMVRLRVYMNSNENSWMVCGGCIWNGRHVITAAHCLTLCDGNTVTGRAYNILICIGDYDQNVNDGETCYRATTWWWHQNYIACQGGWYRNDVAILRVDGGMQVPRSGNNGYGRTAFPLPPVQLFGGESVILSGWGTTNPTPGNANYPDRLKYVWMNVISTSNCRQRWSGVDSSQVCAGGQDGQNSCRGDSGGPLVYYDSAGAHIVGLSSWGPTQCASGGNPNVYSSVYYFKSWFEYYGGPIGA